MTKEVQGHVSELFDQKIEEDPGLVDEATIAKVNFIKASVNNLTMAISARLPSEARPGEVDIPKGPADLQGVPEGGPP